MKNKLSNPRLIGLALIAAITLTLMSVYVERTGPELVQYGNLCGAPAFNPCYEPALKGGFPFGYLFDAPGVSREHQLAFGEDDLHGLPFIADLAVYFASVMLIVWAVSRPRSVIEPNGE